MMSKSAPVKPQMVSSVATNNWVRRRRWVMASRRLSLRFCAGRAGHKFVAGSVNGQEVARIGGVRLQFLAEAEDVVVHRASRWAILVAPHFVEQFVAGKHPSGRSGKEFQEL